jgi:hypothetical protein
MLRRPVERLTVQERFNGDVKVLELGSWRRGQKDRSKGTLFGRQLQSVMNPPSLANFTIGRYTVTFAFSF